MLSEALYQYLCRSGRTELLIRFLNKVDEPILFIVDEFFSINSVKIEKLRSLGKILYISSDIAADFYGDNFIAAKLMCKLEKHMIGLPDFVIACSERDRIKYIQMGAKNALFYPNIYPTEFESSGKDPNPSVAIVLRGHWAKKAQRSLKKVLGALACLDKPVKVYLIGIKPLGVTKNINLKHYDYIQTRADYLRTLGRSWIGINLGIHAGGTNQRKYDYAIAGLVVFSDTFGARGDLLPNEYTFIDEIDLAAKFRQALNLGKERIIEMGEQNRKQAFSLAEEKREEILRIISAI